jgi:hypothetical protein
MTLKKPTLDYKPRSPKETELLSKVATAREDLKKFEQELIDTKSLADDAERRSKMELI